MFADVGVRNFNAISFFFNEDEISDYRSRNNKHFDSRKLEEYLLGSDNSLNVEKIAEDFFPKVEPDIFLSHSHHDEKDIIKLALALERIGLEVFVDSCVWGWADTLLKKIDNKYCLKQDGYYSYENRNRTTANTYMILNSALQNTISKSELFLFLHTENSLKLDSIYKGDEHIESPLIFSELNFAKLCERTPRKKTGIALESLSGIEKRAYNKEDIKFVYPNPGTRYEIENERFLKWLNMPIASGNINKRLSSLIHLDKLYEEIGVPDVLLDESRDIKD